MDQLRQAVEAIVRRVALLGLLGIAAVVAALGHHPRLALDAAAILLGVEVAALWRLGDAAPRSPLLGGALSWATPPGEERRRRRVLADLLTERFRAWSGRLAIPAALTAAIDLASHVVPGHLGQ